MKAFSHSWKSENLFGGINKKKMKDEGRVRKRMKAEG